MTLPYRLGGGGLPAADGLGVRFHQISELCHDIIGQAFIPPFRYCDAEANISKHIERYGNNPNRGCGAPGLGSHLSRQPCAAV